VILSTSTRTAVPQRLSPLVVAAIIVTVLAWASAFIVIRGTAGFFSGGALALGRLLVGSALLSLGMIGRRWVRPTPREWALVAAFGLTWFGVYNVVLNVAERTLDAGTTAMIVNTGPILIALGAGWILREGIGKWLGIGAGVAFVGVVCIGIGTGGAGLGSGCRRGLGDRGGDHLRRRRAVPEAGAAAPPFGTGHVDGLPRRHDRLPAVRR
jgi:drug/metabolite transporter (DMT)-like permease